MKKFYTQKTFWLAAVAVIMAATMSIPNALAYFTTYAEARGGVIVNFETETEIREEVREMTKHIVIGNIGESECYVRVRVFSGNQFQINYSTQSASWSQGSDNYWYCSEIVPVGGATAELLAQIVVPDDYKYGFNIIVVQECTPVLYGTDGQPYADWTRNVISTTDSGTTRGVE